MSETIAHTSEHPWFSFYLLFTSHSLLIAESPAVPPAHPIMAARDVMGPWPMGRAVEKKRKREGVVRGRADPPNMCRITRCLVVRDSPPAPTAAWPARPRQNQRSGPGPHFYASAPPLSAQQLCDGMRTLPIVLSFFSLSFSLTVKL